MALGFFFTDKSDSLSWLRLMPATRYLYLTPRYWWPYCVCRSKGHIYTVGRWWVTQNMTFRQLTVNEVICKCYMDLFPRNADIQNIYIYAREVNSVFFRVIIKWMHWTAIYYIVFHLTWVTVVVSWCSNVYRNFFSESVTRETYPFQQAKTMC